MSVLPPSLCSDGYFRFNTMKRISLENWWGEEKKVDNLLLNFLTFECHHPPPTLSPSFVLWGFLWRFCINERWHWPVNEPQVMSNKYLPQCPIYQTRLSSSGGVMGANVRGRALFPAGAWLICMASFCNCLGALDPRDGHGNLFQYPVMYCTLKLPGWEVNYHFPSWRGVSGDERQSSPRLRSTAESGWAAVCTEYVGK